ncbi:unnamed protein product [Amaranthus hypochondriacus]
MISRESIQGLVKCGVGSGTKNSAALRSGNPISQSVGPLLGVQMKISTCYNVNSCSRFVVSNKSWNPCEEIIDANTNIWYQKPSFTISLNPELIALQHLLMVEA